MLESFILCINYKISNIIHIHLIYIKFLKFWNIIQTEAQKMNSVFFLDCGEGNGFENNEIECVNLSSWLIPFDKVSVFSDIFMNHKHISSEWEEFITFVTWKMTNENITVEFE